MGTNNSTRVWGATLPDGEATYAGGSCAVCVAAAKSQAVGEINLFCGRVTCGSSEVGSTSCSGVDTTEITSGGLEGNEENRGDYNGRDKKRLFNEPECHELSLA